MAPFPTNSLPPPTSPQAPSPRRCRTVAFFEPPCHAEPHLPPPHRPRKSIHIPNFPHRRPLTTVSSSSAQTGFILSSPPPLHRILRLLIYILTAGLLLLLPSLASYAVTKAVVGRVCPVLPSGIAFCEGGGGGWYTATSTPTDIDALADMATPLTNSFTALQSLTSFSPTLEFVGLAMQLASWNGSESLDSLRGFVSALEGGGKGGGGGAQDVDLPRGRLDAVTMATNHALAIVSEWTAGDYGFRREKLIGVEEEGGLREMRVEMEDVLEDMEKLGAGVKERVLSSVVPFGGRWSVEGRVLAIYEEFLREVEEEVEEMVVRSKEARMVVGEWRGEIGKLERILEGLTRRCGNGWVGTKRIAGCGGLDARAEERRMRGVGEAARWIGPAVEVAEKGYMRLLAEMQRARREVEMRKMQIRGLFGLGGNVDSETLRTLLERELQQIENVTRENQAASEVVFNIGVALMETEDDGQEVRRKMEAAIAERRLEWWP